MGNKSPRPRWQPDGAKDSRRSELGPRWRSAPDAVPRIPRRRRPWFSVLLSLVLFAGLSGLLVWAILWLRPAKNTTLLLVGASYYDNLAVPANLYGWQALKDLADFTRNLKPS